jgi:ABC-type multidrug transport system fused ATPase/permease subunit
LIQIFAPLFFLGTIFNMAVTGFVDMFHFCRLMQEDNIIRDAPNAPELNVSNPTIEFKNVYFKYSDISANKFNHTSNEKVVHTNPTVVDEGANKIKIDAEPNGEPNGANAATVNNWIREDVSFTIPAGTSCALVGATGSGKSTCVRLLYRF